jgi:predicted Zn-dependent protease
MGDPRRAYGDAWLIVHTAPKDPWAHRNLGDVSLVMGAPEDALMAYDEALRLDPVDREAKLRRCFALTLLGRGQGASAELQGLATGLSSDAIVWSARALALLRSGDAEARNFAERAAFLDGRDPYVRRALADSVLETGEPAEAMELYAGISAHPVLSACAAYGTALAFLSGGDVKGAATALQKARRPIHLVADDWVPGLFWIRPVPGKESTEAVALAERLVTSTARRDPLALGTLAATLRRAGRGEEARRVAAEAAVIPAPLLIQAALRLLVLTLDPEDRPEVVVSEAG